jgi:hypothetical protein
VRTHVLEMSAPEQPSLNVEFLTLPIAARNGTSPTTSYTMKLEIPYQSL